MRIQHTFFHLTLQLKHQECNGRLMVSAYDHHGHQLTFDSHDELGVETISMQISMPNKIALVLTGKDYKNDIKFDSQGKIIEDKAIELVGMTLAGIKFNSKNLINLTVYHPDRSAEKIRSLTEYLQLGPTGSLLWNRNGCVTLNIFDSNPFAYHLNVGTKIQF